ncbi:glycosyltransferase [Lysinibacter cavernae]|uniref:Glycosyltransferase involved in cell wall biosynthesis n=1 Tax=Lysinibacter cavernae TaxID=1640652 RepID=A0A7X5TUX1_9MICO|nr:glycosyltransferase [Lysinibacter cavernae]NIH55089.1 glycosyltransferase involved in cell wall biosynthesis [Lysinibacter cavernae]
MNESSRELPVEHDDSCSTVSVALGTYNGAAYLETQLLSILTQTRPVSQIVLSDDNSSDDSVAIAKAVVGRHNERGGAPVQLVVLENSVNLRVTKNFEQAIRACTGDLVLLSDQDDTWHPTKVSRLTEVLFSPTGQAPLLAFTDARLVDERGHPLGLTLFEAIEVSASERAEVASGRAFEALLRRNLATGATVAFRRELLTHALPIPEEWVHDEWLAVIAAAVGSVAIVDEPLVDYRQHGANVIGARQQSFWQKLRKLVKPRRDRNRRLFDRARTLAPRLQDLEGVSDERRLAAQQKLEHETVRIRLPRSRFGRIRPILRELKTGRYSLYDYGKKDAVRDFLQPDR